MDHELHTLKYVSMHGVVFFLVQLPQVLSVAWRASVQLVVLCVWKRQMTRSRSIVVEVTVPLKFLCVLVVLGFVFYGLLTSEWMVIVGPVATRIAPRSLLKYVVHWWREGVFLREELF